MVAISRLRARISRAAEGTTLNVLAVGTDEIRSYAIQHIRIKTT